MNRNEQERRNILIMDIAGMWFFGLLGVATFIAGCCGKINQFFLAIVCAIMFAGYYLEYKQIKSK